MTEIPYIYQNKMKWFFIISIFFASAASSISQNSVGTPEQLKSFFKTKTLIVFDEDPFSESNVQLKTAVEKNWKLTEYEFIDVEKFEEKRNSPQYSFLTIDQVFYEGDKSTSTYNFLCLSLGGNYKTESDMPQLCTVPLSYADAEESTYAYKIATMLNFMQNHIALTSGHPELKNSNIIEYYHNNLRDLKDKILYVPKDELENKINTEEKIKKIYPYKFKIVTRDELEEAIDNKLKDVIFLHKVGPSKSTNKARCWKIIMGASDARLYYFDYHRIDENHPDALLENDFKKMVKP